MVKIKDILKTITSLCVITGYASVFQYVSGIYSIVFLLLLGISIYSDYQGIVRLPRWSLNVASFLVLILSVSRVNTEFLVEPILDALVILIAIKLLEDKKFRDYMQIYAMCMFLIMGSSLISLSIVFMLYFSILASFSTMSLILLAHFSVDEEMAISKENMLKIFTHSLLICAIAIPSSVIFFIVLPRTNNPILNFLNRDISSRSGFTDKVTLGDVSDIQEDSSVIFRAEMKTLPDNELYWRGIVMDKFDGVSWSATRGHGTLSPTVRGHTVSQTIYLEPYGNNYLFALDKPVWISLRSSVHMDTLSYSSKAPIEERIRYEAMSVPSGALQEEKIDRDRYLQMPYNFAPEIGELLTKLVGAIEGNETEVVKILFNYLKWGDYKYSLSDLPVSSAPVQDFLQTYKHGNCEYFASSLAVMLRMAGIPARMIGGYRGGYYNDTGKYYLVLQKNAHVWVEAYLAEKGWIRLDPTPAASEIPSVAYSSSFFLKLRIIMDTFNYYWNKFIIGYDFSKQLLIISQLGSSLKVLQHPNLKIHWNEIPVKKLILPASAFMAILLTVALAFVKRRSREERLLSRFLRKMASHGYEKCRSEGLEEFISRIERPDLRDKAHQFAADFHRIYYRDCPFTQQDIKRLKDHIRRLR